MVRHAITQTFGGPDETLCGLPADGVEGVGGCWNEGIFGDVVSFGENGAPDVMRAIEGVDCPMCLESIAKGRA